MATFKNSCACKKSKYTPYHFTRLKLKLGALNSKNQNFSGWHFFVSLCIIAVDADRRQNASYFVKIKDWLKLNSHHLNLKHNQQRTQM
jgi:hypothetical protein